MTNEQLSQILRTELQAAVGDTAKIESVEIRPTTPEDLMEEPWLVSMVFYDRARDLRRWGHMVLDDPHFLEDPSIRKIWIGDIKAQIEITFKGLAG